MPLFIKTKSSKKTFAFIITVILFIVILVGIRWGSIINNDTKKVFNTMKISDYNSNGTDYSRFLINSDKNIKNVLIIGFDKRPEQSIEESRPDIMLLLSIDNDTSNITLLSLGRDTLIKRDIVSGNICKLNESPDIINTIRLNFGIDINEVVFVTWEAVLSIVNNFIPEGLSINLSEIEVMGINQIISSQCESFNRQLNEETIKDMDNVVLGYEELTYIEDTFNYIVEQREDGFYYTENNCKRFDSDKNFICDNGSIITTESKEYKEILENYFFVTSTDSKGNKYVGDTLVIKDGKTETKFHEDNHSAHIYKIETLLRGTSLERKFSSEENTYLLNDMQVLAYMRLRHSYKDQDNQRQFNTMTIMTEILREVLDKLDDNFYQKFISFISECGENQYIQTSYESIDNVITDFAGKSIDMGKVVVIDDSAKKYTSLPMVYVNYSQDVITDVYMSLKRQAELMLYDIG